MARSKLISLRALLASLLMGLGATSMAQPSSSVRIAPDRGQQQASVIFQILASELALSQGEVGVAAAT